ncbi:MAG TPA: LPS assembly protein LptD [Candidatus Cybelea sp.]|nr:LPS assembly protein LptD [Candidatus Cybelea sp.]
MAALLGATALALVFAVLPGFARAASDSPVGVIADEAGYDQDLGVYVARGHVEMEQDDRILMADVVTYNERARTMSASGNVVLLMPGGDTVFGSYVDVTDDFKDGVVQGFRALLRDKSRLAAYSAHRVGGTKEILTKAVYTPCLPCRTDPKRQPVWQIKADQVVRDEVAQTVTYHNAWMEMWGVPVFWTPYFQHADAGVTRKSGLLNPSFSVSSGHSGVQAREPYFWALGDDKDVTITPIARGFGEPTPAGGLLDLQYRQRVPNGAFQLEGSGTYEAWPSKDVSDRTFRGHVAGGGLFDLSQDWRWGFDFKNTSDEEYLRQYHFGSRRWLEDTLWSEGFFGRSYFEARGFGWQTTDNDLRNETAPIIAPLINYDFVSEPGTLGGVWGVRADVMNLMRQQGRNSFRLAMLPSWTLPYTGPWGDVYELKLSLAADLYVTNRTDPGSNNVNPSSSTNTFAGAAGRIFPQGSFKWRYPFVHPGKSFTQTLQPIVQLVMSPQCCNTGKIPNEDTRSFNWDDSKVFAPDRFSGYDRVDDGSRVNYGLEWSAYNDHGGRADVFLGQSYQFIPDHNVPSNSGIDRQLTDIVGRASIEPADWFDATYRFRFDTHRDQMRDQEISFSAGPQALRLGLSYVHLAGNQTFDTREQLAATVTTKFYDYWSTSLGGTYDLTKDRFNRLHAGFGYNDDCFGVNLYAQYNAEGDTDISSGKFAAFVTFTFKNLGNFGGSF